MLHYLLSFLLVFDNNIFFKVVQNAFTLISSEKTLTLACPSEENKKEWMNRFQTLQDDLLSKINQQKGTSNEGGLKVRATITGTKKLYDKAGKSFTVIN